MTEPTATQPVSLRLDDVANLLTMSSVSDWDPTKHPEFAESFHRAAAVKDAAMAGQPAPQDSPPPPPGDYGCVHVMGHTQCEGWVSDGSIAGAACLDVRDEAGRLIAKIPPHSVYMYEPRIPPRVLAAASRPLAELPAGEPGPLPSGAYEGYYPEPGDEDSGPADEFAGHRGPDDTAIL